VVVSLTDEVGLVVEAGLRQHKITARRPRERGRTRVGVLSNFWNSIRMMRTPLTIPAGKAALFLVDLQEERGHDTRYPGRERYPDAKRLMITAGGGGSNGSRGAAVETGTPEALADELHMPITVCHLPPRRA